MKKELLDVRMIDWWDDHWYKIRYLDEAKIEQEDYFASVTTKLGALAKPHLTRWYGDVGTREAQRIMHEAADRGTRIHWAWYFWTNGGAVVYQDRRNPAYSREEMDSIYKRYNNQVWTLEFQDEHYDFLKLVQMFYIFKPEIIESEKKVFHVEHQEAGTADNIMNLKEGEYEVAGAKPLTLPGGWYLGDLKTGKQIGKDAYMQVAAYVYCAESMGYNRFQGALIYHTSSTTKKGIEGLNVHHLVRTEIDDLYSDYRDISRVWERQFSGKKPIIRQLPCLVVREDSWTQSKDSSASGEKESQGKNSMSSSEKPKPEASPPETKSLNKTSNLSSDKPEGGADTTKTPSKKA